LTPSPTPSPIPTWTSTPTVTPVPIPTKKYQTPGDYIDILTVNGVERWFTVHVPPVYRPGVPVPLVINLHGRTGTAFQQETLTQMNAKADKEGFIAVNPQALGNPSTWWGVIPGSTGQADIDFFDDMLAYLQREISIDPVRIYVTGMSNGATMANRLGCDFSDTIAAIALVSGGHVAFDRCEVVRPVSVLVMHGTDDWIIPYDGNGTDVPSVRAWVEAWAERDGCDPTPNISHPHEIVTRETWEGCAGNATVTFLTLVGGGHTWPGAPLSVTTGSSFVYINATDVIWHFFASHPRSPTP
jgi:polyhydroxybutyrate depolymerase